MAEAAVSEYYQPVDSEQYAHSLSTVRRLGRYVLDGQVDSSEARRTEAILYADFVTSIAENLKTDPEFRDRLDVGSERTDSVINDQVRAADGTPMSEMVARGLQASRLAAVHDPRMLTQVIRDQGDLEVVSGVDRLAVGQASLHVSLEPKAELNADPEFWNRLGYRSGIAYIQTYTRTTEGVVAGTYSVDMSDLEDWRRLFADHGVTLPDDVTPNTLVRHGITFDALPDQTRCFADNLRRSYYQRCGNRGGSRSVSDYVNAHGTFLRNIFDGQYRAVCEAVSSGEATPAVIDLVGALLGQAEALNPAMRRQLLCISLTGRCSAEDGRLLEAAVRYAAVEQLRKGLHGFVESASDRYEHADFNFSGTIDVRLMNDLLAHNINAGAQAGRSYGGCAAGFDPGGGSESAATSTSGGSKQSTYGGVDSAGSTTSESAGGTCEYMHDSCYCCPYDDAGRPMSQRMIVKARRDSKGNARCMRSGCGAEINSDNTVVSFGEIYKKAQQLRVPKLHQNIVLAA